MQLFGANTFHELTHPQTNEPTGLTLEFLPSDHDDVSKALFEAFKSQRGKTELEFEALLKSRIQAASACIVGWEVKGEHWIQAFKQLGIEDLTFSPEKLIKLLSMKTAGWIRTQVDTVIADKDRVFKQASSV
jgi:hypothetical protein